MLVLQHYEEDRKLNYCYHITTRCNNREFNLQRLECRLVFLYAIKKAIEKYQFKLYGLCIMHNHVHYLMEPNQSTDLPKIMHWLNWYTAMCFNRMLNRTGHFWEKRYFKEGFPNQDYSRVLNTLRYIHANPKNARMKSGFFYDFSNYGTYHRLTDDGITQWHPAFLSLANTLEQCSHEYRRFCQKQKPKNKNQNQVKSKSPWGCRFLPHLTKSKNKQKHTNSPGQLQLFNRNFYCSLNFDQVNNDTVVSEVANRFVEANRYPLH